MNRRDGEYLKARMAILERQAKTLRRELQSAGTENAQLRADNDALRVALIRKSVVTAAEIEAEKPREVVDPREVEFKR